MWGGYHSLAINGRVTAGPNQSALNANRDYPCYKAIEKITNIKGELLDYSIQSVTRGKDALGEVTVKVKMKGRKVIAQGVGTGDWLSLTRQRLSLYKKHQASPGALTFQLTGGRINSEKDCNLDLNSKMCKTMRLRNRPAVRFNWFVRHSL